MKTYGGVDVQIHVFLAYTLFGGEWSASSPAELLKPSLKLLRIYYFILYQD
jgi:hypothetical protein